MTLEQYLLAYWPGHEEINACIKTEAETLDESVLLAVHQPFELRRFPPFIYGTANQQSGDGARANEEELLSELVTKNVPSGAHVIAITGRSGAGKSHMVRILAARLRAANQNGRYVIIRIPKSASLREVVRLILEKLPDNQDYAKVRKEFNRALDGFKIDHAVINFEAALQIELGERSKELRAQIDAEGRNPELIKALGHTRDLQEFLPDPVIRQHFRETVYPRIVNRATRKEEQTKGDEAPTEDFSSQDFLLPETLSPEQASEKARRYYQLQLTGEANLENRQKVAHLLNEKIVDKAIRRLFNLHESMGGKTLAEVIHDIRKQLFLENKELVILVEDFVALAGIQHILLDELILQGIQDGQQVMATIRSVIAVTDGYLAGRQTIDTRAIKYVVESELSSEGEVLKRTRELVASYLNASRWGVEKIKQRAQQGETGQLPTWPQEEQLGHDEHGQALRAFGIQKLSEPEGDREVPLFPYTEEAIDQLAKLRLPKLNQELIFSPRFIINGVLRDLLLHGRPAFEQGDFPSSNLVCEPASADVREWLHQLGLTDQQRQRYERFVQIWGNEPENREAIYTIDKLVFKAFQLKPPEGGSDARQVWPPGNDELVADLEAWGQGKGALPQMRTDQIRNCLSRTSIPAGRVLIPDAIGGETTDINPIELRKDAAKSVAAVVRYYGLDPAAHYTQAPNDQALIYRLVNSLMGSGPDIAPPVPDRPNGYDALSADIENWARNIVITQARANTIRNSVVQALKYGIDWEAERYITTKVGLIDIHVIFIPNAQGNHGPRPIKIANDNQDVTGQISKELLAVVSFYALANGQMSYSEADNDRIRIACLVERLKPQALELVRSRAQQNLVSTINLLSWNSRILGLKPPKNTIREVAEFLFSTPLQPQELPPGSPEAMTNWRNKQSEALGIRTEIIKSVVHYSGSFQGNGDTAYALDMPRIFASFRQNVDAPLTLQQNQIAILANEVFNVTHEISKVLTEALGDGFDKIEVTRELNQLTLQLSGLGTWPENNIGMNANAFRSLCGEFSKCALLGALKLIPQPEELEKLDRSERVNRAGSLDLSPLVTARRFVEYAGKVVREAEKCADQIENHNAGLVAPETIANEIQKLFEDLLLTLPTPDGTEE